LDSQPCFQVHNRCPASHRKRSPVYLMHEVRSEFLSQAAFLPAHLPLPAPSHSREKARLALDLVFFNSRVTLIQESPICSSVALSSSTLIVKMPTGPTMTTLPHRRRKSIPTTVDVCSEIENSPWTKKSPSRQAYPWARGTGSEVLPFARVYKVVACASRPIRFADAAGMEIKPLNPVSTSAVCLALFFPSGETRISM